MQIPFDIGIVTYNAKQDLDRLLQSIKKQNNIISDVVIHIWDNSDSEQSHTDTEKLNSQYNLNIKLYSSQTNIGFGQGVNQIAQKTNAPWLFILNQDTVLDDDSTLNKVINAINNTSSNDAIIECRQKPYEHPKLYNPINFQTSWTSGAAFLINTAIFNEVGGFDSHIFMYGEDVDLSWRLRSKGYQLLYRPDISVTHNTYQDQKQVKPMQAIEGTFTNLCLRARYGNYIDILKGLFLLSLDLLLRHSSFQGKPTAFLKLYPRYFKQFNYFRQSGKTIRQSGFKPIFHRWNYEVHRRGSFHSHTSNTLDQLPLVSIIIRTYNRPNFLREALLSVKHQIYPNIETIIIDDGSFSARHVINELNLNNVNLIESKTNHGRSHAGNLGLDAAKGEWICFLDDDDLLFCDHIDVLISKALQSKAKAFYSNAFETVTDIIEETPTLNYKEFLHFIRFKRAFSQDAILESNFIPIQSILFHRSLYENYGGFNETLTYLEDWELWARYSRENNFIYLDKTTSKYRVPLKQNMKRQQQIDEAYHTVVKEHITTNDNKESILDQKNNLIRKLKQWIRRLSKLPLLKPVYYRRQTIRIYLEKLKFLLQ